MTYALTLFFLISPLVLSCSTFKIDKTVPCRCTYSQWEDNLKKKGLEKTIRELENITTKPKVAGKVFMMDLALGKDPFEAAEKDRAELERLRRVLAGLREELDDSGGGQ